MTLLSRAVLLSYAVLALGACAREESPAPSRAERADTSAAERRFDAYFQLADTLRILPIERFEKPPASLVLLADGRIILPETEGVWLHVAGPDGRGITRFGGASPVPLESADAQPGTFVSVANAAVMPDGRLLVGDRSSRVVSVFNTDFEPVATVSPPETRNVWQIEAYRDDQLVAAVAPLHPTGGGEVVVWRPDGAERAFFTPDPGFLHNRWGSVSAARVEVLRGGRILVHWPVLPWAKAISSSGDTLAPVGWMSPGYRGPSTGPGAEATLEQLAAWYGSFTPLVEVEAAGELIVFQFLGLYGQEERRRAARPTFVNLYDEAGEPLAPDVPLPAGHQILNTNDPSRLWILTRATPHELIIERWLPRAQVESNGDR